MRSDNCSFTVAVPCYVVGARVPHGTATVRERQRPDWICLPDKWDIHEYSIMERFCLSVEKKSWQNQLLNAIRGRGAFRYFKDTAARLGLPDSWYDYRRQAFREIAIDWLEENNIAYEDRERPPV